MKKKNSITITMSVEVYKSLKSEVFAVGLNHGLYNAPYLFLGELLKRIEKEQSEWDCHYKSEEKECAPYTE